MHSFSKSGLPAVLLLTVLAFGMINGSARGQDCDPLKPDKPVDSKVSNQVKADANALFHTLGSAHFEDDFEKTQQSTLNKYPHADKVLIGEYHIYFLCTLLKSSKLSDNEKLDRFQHLTDAQADLLSPPTDQ